MMEKKKKLIIFALAIALIIVFIVIIVSIKNNKNNKKDTNVSNQNATNVISEDGTTKIESDKLAETRKYNGLEISNIRFEVKDNLNCLMANVKNTTSKNTEEQYLDFHIYDKDGKKLEVLTGYIRELKPNEEQNMTTTLTTNGKEYDSYDVVITKKDEPSPRDTQNTNTSTNN